MEFYARWLGTFVKYGYGMVIVLFSPYLHIGIGSRVRPIVFDYDSGSRMSFLNEEFSWVF